MHFGPAGGLLSRWDVGHVCEAGAGGGLRGDPASRNQKREANWEPGRVPHAAGRRGVREPLRMDHQCDPASLRYLPRLASGCGGRQLRAAGTGCQPAYL